MYFISSLRIYVLSQQINYIFILTHIHDQKNRFSEHFLPKSALYVIMM